MTLVGSSDGPVSTLKDSRASSSITAKQAAWEKQLESADQKQSELSNLQWNLVREQLSSLTREVATIRHDSEAHHASEQKRVVREADFARVVRETQAELEKESVSRQKDCNEFFSALSQLKEIIESEREARTEALQKMESDVADQLQNLKLEQQQHLEADKGLSSRFEHWCIELRTTLDKESSDRGQKMEELEEGVKMLMQNLGQATREHTDSMVELSNKSTALRLYMEREIAARKYEIEQLSHSTDQLIAKVDKDDCERACIADIRRMEASLQKIEAQISPLHLALDCECEERRSMGEGLQKQYLQMLSEMEGRYADLQRLVELLAKDAEVQAQQVSRTSEGYCAEMQSQLLSLRATDAGLQSNLDMLAQRVAEGIEQEREQNRKQHQAHVERHMELDEKLSKQHIEICNEQNQRQNAADERLCKSQQTHEFYAERLEEVNRVMQESLSRVGSDTELRATQAANRLIEGAAFISKADFEQATKDMWDALDTHTHDVDMAGLTTAQQADQPPPTLLSRPGPTHVYGSPSVTRRGCNFDISPGVSLNQKPGILVKGPSLPMPVPLGTASLSRPLARSGSLSGSLSLPVSTPPPPGPFAMSPNLMLRRSGSQGEFKPPSKAGLGQTSSIQIPPEYLEASGHTMAQMPLGHAMLPIQPRSVTPVRR